jgi:hypothetical protein
VAFTPWTSLDDHRAWLDYLEVENLIDAVDPVQYGLRLLVPPGSLLLESAGLRPHVGALEQETLSYRWTHPDPRMDALQAETAQVVARAVEEKADAPVIFDRVRARAATAAGVPAPAPVAAGMSRGRERPPRLTEAWFC